MATQIDGLDYPDCDRSFASAYKKQFTAVLCEYQTGMWAVVQIKTPKSKWCSNYLATKVDGWWVYLPCSSHYDPISRSPDGVTYRLSNNGKNWCVRRQAYDIEVLKVSADFSAAMQHVHTMSIGDLHGAALANRLTGLALCLGMSVARSKVLSATPVKLEEKQA